MRRLRLGTMKEYMIHSLYLQEEMTIKVFKPEQFSLDYRYNLCIFQDGEHYFQMGRLATLSDKLHKNKQIEPTVFVGIHFKDQEDRRRKYHPDGKLNKAYMNFLIFEVVPFLDQMIPLAHEGKARTLMGDSLAGTLALMTAEKYPNTFSRVIMQSPYVNETVLKQIEKSRRLHQLEIYHSIGTKESSVKTSDGKILDFITPNRILQRKLSEAARTYHYVEIPEGDHTWKYWQGDLKRALLMMYSKNS